MSATVARRARRPDCAAGRERCWSPLPSSLARRGPSGVAADVTFGTPGGRPSTYGEPIKFTVPVTTSRRR